MASGPSPFNGPAPAGLPRTAPRREDGPLKQQIDDCNQPWRAQAQSNTQRLPNGLQPHTQQGQLPALNRQLPTQQLQLPPRIQQQTQQRPVQHRSSTHMGAPLVSRPTASSHEQHVRPAGLMASQRPGDAKPQLQRPGASGAHEQPQSPAQPHGSQHLARSGQAARTGGDLPSRLPDPGSWPGSTAQSALHSSGAMGGLSPGSRMHPSASSPVYATPPRQPTTSRAPDNGNGHAEPPVGEPYSSQRRQQRSSVRSPPMAGLQPSGLAAASSGVDTEPVGSSSTRRGPLSPGSVSPLPAMGAAKQIQSRAQYQSLQQPQQLPSQQQQQQQPPFSAGPQAVSGMYEPAAPRFAMPPPPSFGAPRRSTPQHSQGAMPDGRQSEGRSDGGPRNGMWESGRSGPLIDPKQIPRPRTMSSADAEDSAPEGVIFETRVNGKHALPPPTATNIVVRDCGNASPRFMRMTLNYVPISKVLQKTSHMPFAVIIQPMALLRAGEYPIQVVDSGEDGPPRCQRCKAYVNPFTHFTDNGDKFRCNFCSHSNMTPPSYVCALNHDGTRLDKYDRPELCCGSVEFIATKEYMVRPPMTPTHFFLIDVSFIAVTSGATAAACASVARVLDELPGGDRALAGVATFDSTIHFYSLRPSQSQPQMLVVPDVSDPYAPQSASLICSVKESRALLDSLLESIPRMFADSQIAESCAGAAIHAAIDVLAGVTGGKLHIFMSSLARNGAHALRLRDAPLGAGAKDALSIMAPGIPDYKALAITAADAQVCVDLFVMAQSYVDVASLKELCHNTAGSLHHYQPFNALADADQFWNDFHWSVVRPQALEAVARLRCSAGIDVTKYMGAFYRRTPTDIDLPALNSDQAFAVTLRHNEKLAEGSEVYLQFALLYSSTDGQRLVRVHNMGLPTTTVLGSTFRGADLEAQLAVTARQAVGGLPSGSLQAAKDAIDKTVVNVLHTYRRHCATDTSPGQLILPEALKLLPLYTLAMQKMACFRSETQHDARAVDLFRVECAPAHTIIPLLHARLIPLHHNLADFAGNDEMQARLVGVSLSSEKLDPEGLYLLENGVDALIYIGKEAPQRVIQDLLGVESLESVSASGSQPLMLPSLDTIASRGVNRVLGMVRQERGAYMRTRVLKRGDLRNRAFFAALIEDRSSSGMSYVEFLCHVHTLIQNRH